MICDKSNNVSAEELHSVLKDLLKIFHEICEENGIKYYVLGGTCLGARRHRGFIPWDDDIDVGIPRRDYDKFCEIMKYSNYPSVSLRYYKTVPNCPFHFVKFINNQTTLIENSYRNYVEGVYIDVFPLDDARYDEIGRFRRCNRIWLTATILNLHCTTIKRHSIIKKLIIGVCKLLDWRLIHLCLEKEMTRHTGSNGYGFYANFLGAWHEKEIIKKTVFGTPTKYQFEDMYVYGPERIDEYLTCLYGDFMSLPNEKERVFRHGFFYVDLNNSYVDYLRENDEMGTERNE